MTLHSNPLYVAPLHKANAAAMQPNIFVLIEEYLNRPSTELANKIKQHSHQLTNDAFEKAKIKFPNKIKTDAQGNKIPNIGADEYAPILLDDIKIQAEEATALSIRMAKNNVSEENITKDDKQFIFRLNADQKASIHRLIGELLKQSTLHPDGLIFAYDGYIERRGSTRFKYLEGIEADAYDFCTKLYLKAKELERRAEHEVAEVIYAGCQDIKSDLATQDPERMQRIRKTLTNLEQNEKIQEHRGSLKTIIINFLLLVSIVGALYLAATTQQRGAFFYRPQTDTELQVKSFDHEISANTRVIHT